MRWTENNGQKWAEFDLHSCLRVHAGLILHYTEEEQEQRISEYSEFLK